MCSKQLSPDVLGAPDSAEFRPVAEAVLRFFHDDLLRQHRSYVDGTVVRERALTRCCRDAKVQGMLLAVSEKASDTLEHALRLPHRRIPAYGSVLRSLRSVVSHLPDLDAAVRAKLAEWQALEVATASVISRRANDRKLEAMQARFMNEDLGFEGARPVVSEEGRGGGGRPRRRTTTVGRGRRILGKGGRDEAVAWQRSQAGATYTRVAMKRGVPPPLEAAFSHQEDPRFIAQGDVSLEGTGGAKKRCLFLLSDRLVVAMPTGDEDKCDLEHREPPSAPSIPGPLQTRAPPQGLCWPTRGATTSSWTATAGCGSRSGIPWCASSLFGP